MASKGGVGPKLWEIPRGSDAYPARLGDIDEPPERLFVRGDPEVLQTMCLGVIGARRPTPYGLACAAMAGRIAAESGVTLVSGGAMGCDAAAGRAALDAGGKTIVVAGVGADTFYPTSSRDVFDRAARGGGAVVSIVPWGSAPLPFNFPNRNKVIAALATAIVVTEAGRRSGTTGTALAATEMGREVYAVPGSIFSPESQGANALIRDGASIVACEEDLEALITRDFGLLRLVGTHVAAPRGRVLSALVASPMRADDLADRLGMDPLELLRCLADYEVSGMIKRLPDGRYAPTEQTLLATE